MKENQIKDRQHPWLKLQKVLRLYDARWNEWLQSDACFLSAGEESMISFLFAFKGDIFCSARMLNLAEEDYLIQLNQLIGKLERNQLTYLAWLQEATCGEGGKNYEY